MSYFWNTELEKYKTHANHISAESQKNYLSKDILHIPFLTLPATLPPREHILYIRPRVIIKLLLSPKEHIFYKYPLVTIRLLFNLKISKSS